MEYAGVIIMSQNLIDLLDEGIYIDPITENCCPICKINQNKIKCHWGDLKLVVFIF